MGHRKHRGNQHKKNKKKLTEGQAGREQLLLDEIARLEEEIEKLNKDKAKAATQTGKNATASSSSSSCPLCLPRQAPTPRKSEHCKSCRGPIESILKAEEARRERLKKGMSGSRAALEVFSEIVANCRSDYSDFDSESFLITTDSDCEK